MRGIIGNLQDDGVEFEMPEGIEGEVLEVPIWYLQSVVRQVSRRFAPRPEIRPKRTLASLTKCGVCLQYTSPDGKGAQKRVIRRLNDRSQCWHEGCWERVHGNETLETTSAAEFIDTSGKGWESSGDPNAPKVVYPSPGNLPEDQYRYWIGSSMKWAKFAMCRRCGVTVESGPEMATHNKEDFDPVTHLPCMGLLNRAYKEIIRVRHCIICSGPTQIDKYGIPLCGASCVQAWKFAQVQNPVVKKYLKIVEDGIVQALNITLSGKGVRVNFTSDQAESD